VVEVILNDIAWYLHNQDIITYDPRGLSGNIFIDTLPNNPDEAVALYNTAGTGELGIDIDELGMQVITRGTRDPRVAYDLAWDIYNKLHGFGTGYLTEDGAFFLDPTFPADVEATRITDIQATDAPFHISSSKDGTTDNSGRHLYSTNYIIRTKNNER